MYINEHMMDVYINDHLTMKLVCLPQHLTELVLGRLLTEQIITSSEDVDHITLSTLHGNTFFVVPSASGSTGCIK